MSPRRESTVDWRAVRERLDDARRSLDQLDRIAPEHERQLLRDRARDLATRITPSRTPTERELITFGVGQEQYAIESRRVVEIFPVRELVPVPGAPAPIVGLAVWRGSILVVSELVVTIGAPDVDPTRRRYVVVLGGNDSTIGFLVDSAGEVLAASAGEMMPVPQGISAKAETVSGVLRGAVLVLDADALLRQHAQLS